jgi:hypothetical protein
MNTLHFAMCLFPSVRSARKLREVLRTATKNAAIIQLLRHPLKSGDARLEVSISEYRSALVEGKVLLLGLSSIPCLMQSCEAPSRSEGTLAVYSLKDLGSNLPEGPQV